VYTGQVMTGDWDSDVCVRYKIECAIYTKPIDKAAGA
jgi:hypothetical protein